MANAGHPPVLLRRSDEEVWNPVELHWTDGIADLPLGMFRQTAYHQVSVPLRPGDRLALYTDGFTEGTDCQDSAFGEGSLRNSLLAHGHLELEKLKDRLLDDLRQHVGGRLEQDDVTLLLVEIASQPASVQFCGAA